MQILIFGGTNFFGANVVEQLLAAGHGVSIFSRGNAQPAWWRQVEHIVGDRSDLESMRSALQHRTFDLVIDNIAYTGTDVQNALAVLKGKIGRYLLTSTAGIYRFVPERTMPLYEDDVDFSWTPTDFDPAQTAGQYQAGKREAERALRNQELTPYTIIRPPIVFGPHDQTLRGYFYIQRLLDGQPLILTNGGVSSFRLAYSWDLARAFLLAVESPQAVGRTYTVAQREIITLRDFINAAAAALGVEPNLINIPADVIKQAGLAYPDPYGGMINFIPAVQRVEAELGYTCTPYPKWIGETAIWYRDEYKGKDSDGYAQRQDEIAFAEWYRARVLSATPDWHNPTD